MDSRQYGRWYWLVFFVVAKEIIIIFVVVVIVIWRLFRCSLDSGSLDCCCILMNANVCHAVSIQYSSA
jgi:hypothetical protein